MCHLMLLVTRAEWPRRVTDRWRLYEAFLAGIDTYVAFCNVAIKLPANNARYHDFSERAMKLAIVTDAWRPQVNGVVTTLSRTSATLAALGHEVEVFSPDGHYTIPCPTYPEIRLALLPRKRLGDELERYDPDAIHVATEGPLGMSAVGYCRASELAFT